MAFFDPKLVSGVSIPPLGSPGGNVSNQPSKIRCNSKNKIGTWNVRSLYQAGKLNNIVAEMERMNIEILGISDVQWPDSGECPINDYHMYYSGSSDQHHR